MVENGSSGEHDSGRAPSDSEIRHYWTAATSAIVLWFVVQVMFFAIIMRFVDPGYDEIPPIAVVAPACFGIVVAVAIRRLRMPIARGASVGIITAAALLLTILLFVGI
ncbi:hypothetical protein [Nocardia sp. R6R-6]|uniref:hypothetical protein n=1 Tax=Nocardia sp. R6R-6 TaxID=3459303 RepID=UPI00403E0A82